MARRPHFGHLWVKASHFSRSSSWLLLLSADEYADAPEGSGDVIEPAELRQRLQQQQSPWRHPRLIAGVDLMTSQKHKSLTISTPFSPWWELPGTKCSHIYLGAGNPSVLKKRHVSSALPWFLKFFPSPPWPLVPLSGVWRLLQQKVEAHSLCLLMRHPCYHHHESTAYFNTSQVIGILPRAAVHRTHLQVAIQPMLSCTVSQRSDPLLDDEQSARPLQTKPAKVNFQFKTQHFLSENTLQKSLFLV